MGSFTPSAIALGSLFAVAAVLSLSRAPVPAEQVRSVNRLVWFTCGAQALHLTEEVAFELNVRLPAAFGFPGMSFSFFLFINIAALVVWFLGSLREKYDPIVAITFWFLGLASVFNLIAHPIMALSEGGYFPGVVTAPLVGFTGFLLLRRLFEATRHDPGSGAAA